MYLFADMAELADALDLGSSAFGRGGSTPFIRIVAGLAQLVEHLICNQAVEGSTPLAGINFTQLLDAEVVQW